LIANSVTAGELVGHPDRATLTGWAALHFDLEWSRRSKDNRVATTVQENPLRAGMRLQCTPEPCALVLMGATGDLAHRKILPSLYNLAVDHLLPHGFALIGMSRQPYTDARFREEMLDAVSQHSRYTPVQPEVWESFAQSLFFMQGDFLDASSFQRLEQRLAEVDAAQGTQGNRIFYLATAPSVFGEIADMLGKSGLITRRASGQEWTRLVIEKPFGRDLASAQSLNSQLRQVLKEDQIFRIDHYLGKETVQNIIVFRFANGLFEPIWNRNYIDNIQITVAEDLGIDHRGSYYEGAGALRDMVQSHMLQLVALTAMEPPVALDPDAVRDEKVKIFRAVEHFTSERVDRDVVRGQYGPGWIGGKPVPGYRQEEDVAPDSTTETYVALKLEVDNWRWAGTPFYLRTGKRLPKRETEIAIVFRRAPLALFQELDPRRMESNVLAMRIQPDEGISLKFAAKVPGQGFRIQPVYMDFLYGASFTRQSADAYERLLLDIMLGDSTLFTRADEVEAEWSIVTPILEGWRLARPPDFPSYEAGSWGPEAAIDLIRRDHHSWRKI
jgi:glucose-6-phosphate 1-dehydrogenase